MAKPRLPPPAKNQKQPLSIAELGAKAEALEAGNDRTGAAQIYRDWIKHSKSPLVWVAQFNLGVLLRNLGDPDGAVEAYKASLATNPKLPHARINLGTVLEVLNRPDEAIDEWKIALGHLDADPKADPELVCTVLNNLGRRLEVMQKYTEAEEMLTRSLLIKPKQDAVLYHRIFLRQKQCAWPIYDPLPGITLEDQQAATSAVAMLSISDDPELQLRTALSQVPGKIPKDLPKLAPADGYAHDRLRIAYLSSNFGMHAVSILTAELYELHDRSRVEVWGFCWSPEDNTEMRERVIKAMDHFVRIKDMSDEEAAKAIRAAEIDVLIDLQGLTAGCRPTILAYRPAPIQITYLGFPGTTALPEVDYVLADRYIIPEDMAKYFTEKPLYLHHCFQVNDRKRIASEPKTRAEYGLPENAFVFCAFNNNIKFTPEFFACWMRILKRTPNSVLWLLADNEKARSNLGKFSEELGVSNDRLIFAPRVPVADYLARFAVADLFLDLFPFNGGTTAADALWMGLPIVTCSGRSFASRMAGSLLRALGLPELVTTSLPDYENLAVAIAHNPDRAKDLKARTLANKENHPLFDTPTLVREMEDLLLETAPSTNSVTINAANNSEVGLPMPDAVDTYVEAHVEPTVGANGIDKISYSELFGKFDRVMEDSIRIPGKPAWIILCGYAIGETALLCSLANEFVKTHGHGIVLVVTPKHVPVARMYAHRFLKVVVMPDDYMRIMLRSGYIPQDRFELDQPLSGCWIDLGFRASDGVKYLGRFPGRGGISEPDTLRFLLRLPWNARLDPPRISPEWEDDAWNFAKQGGLRSGRSVLLCPINNSQKKLPDIFWKTVAERLNDKGYKVFTNMGGLNPVNGPPTMPVEGTTPVDLPINLVVSFANFAGRVITGSNGMLNLMLLAGFETFKLTHLVQVPLDSDETDNSSLGYKAPAQSKATALHGSAFQILLPELCLRTPMDEFIVPDGSSPEEFVRLAIVVAEGNTEDSSCYTRYELNGKPFLQEHANWLKELI